MLAKCPYCSLRVRPQQLLVHEKHCQRKKFAIKTQAQRVAQGKIEPVVKEKTFVEPEVIEPKPKKHFMKRSEK